MAASPVLKASALARPHPHDRWRPFRGFSLLNSSEAHVPVRPRLWPVVGRRGGSHNDRLEARSYELRPFPYPSKPACLLLSAAASRDSRARARCSRVEGACDTCNTPLSKSPWSCGRSFCLWLGSPIGTPSMWLPRRLARGCCSCSWPARSSSARPFPSRS